jgi:hypothetical protein
LNRNATTANAKCQFTEQSEFSIDPCAAAASRRAEKFGYAPRRRRIFSGSAESQPKI